MRRDYIFKVWASSLVAEPVLMMTVTAFILAKEGTRLDKDTLGFIAFAIGYGLLLSVPTFLIVYPLFHCVSKKVYAPIKIKLVLWFTGVIGILTTFYLLYGGGAYKLIGNYAALSFSITYSFCLTLFSFIFPIACKEAPPIKNTFLNSN